MKIITTILCILVLFAVSVICGSPPQTFETASTPAKVVKVDTDLGIVQADVSGHTIHKQNTSNQQTLAQTVGELASNPYPAKAYKRSRFDFKMRGDVQTPETTTSRFDKPPLSAIDVVDFEARVLRL